MKITKLTSFQKLFIYPLILFFLGCSKNEIPPSVDGNSSIKKTDIRVIDGILFFKSIKYFEDFSKTYEYYNSQNRLNFEKENHFSSLLTTIENTKNLTEIEIQKYSTDNELVNYNSGSLEHSLVSNSIAALVNSNGYVIIGSSLFHFGGKEVSSISIEKCKTLPNAILALRGEGDKELQNFIKSSNIAFDIKPLKDKSARYNLGNNTFYSQSGYATTSDHYPSGYRYFRVQLEGRTEIQSFGYWYEYYDEYEPYNEDCRCYSGIGTPHVSAGYAAFIRIAGNVYKKYANGEIQRNEPTNYIRVKSTNATVYANGVAVPVRYDDRVSNVSQLEREPWSLYQAYDGNTRTLLEVEGSFDFEAQLERLGMILTTSVVY